MSLGISPKLPLELDTHVGSYKLNKTHKETIKQNFKNLVLTSPGERIMDPSFGVGLRRYLFEPIDTVVPKIRQRIQQQIAKYMPFIRVTKLRFNEGLDPKFANDSLILKISIQYDVPSMNLSAELKLQAEDIN